MPYPQVRFKDKRETTNIKYDSTLISMRALPQVQVTMVKTPGDMCMLYEKFKDHRSDHTNDFSFYYTSSVPFYVLICNSNSKSLNLKLSSGCMAWPQKEGMGLGLEVER